jgi:PAS domain S-box-containing protein
MERIHRLRRERSPSHASQFGWRLSATLFLLSLVLLGIAVFAGNLHTLDLSSVLLGIALSLLCVVFVLFFRFLLLARDLHQKTATDLDASENSLLASEGRFRQMADNIQEVFWMIDARTQTVLYLNPAFELITGRSPESLGADAASYKTLLHPEDRIRVLAKIEGDSRTGEFDEKFRIILPNHELRWVWVRGFPVRDPRGTLLRLVGSALDITAQKEAEAEVAGALAAAQSAWAESDAMRKASLALTQDLRLDYVLDTLLKSLRDLVPYETACISLVEADSRLFVARRSQESCLTKLASEPSSMFETGGHPLVRRVLETNISVFVPDTNQDPEWIVPKADPHLQSWLCVPLIASRRIVGLLSLGHTVPNALTVEHLRIAELLAIPAAAAIQNARLYERTEIYSEELEKRLQDLHQTQTALEKARGTDSPTKQIN